MTTPTEAATRMLAWFRDSPLYRELVRGERQARAASRSDLIDQLETVERQLREADADGTAKLAPLLAAETKAQAAFEQARAKRLAAARQAANGIGTLRAHRDHLMRDLLTDVDAEIDAARQAMYARWQTDRATARRIEERPMGCFDLGSGKRIVEIWSNEPAIKRLLAAMRAAAGELEALKVRKYDDVEAAIAEILRPVQRAWEEIGMLESTGQQAAA